MSEKHDCHKEECLKTWGALHCEKCLDFSPDIPGECCLWSEIRRLQGLADIRRKAEERLYRTRTEVEADNAALREALRVGLLFVLEQKRMLDQWAEADDKLKTELWQGLHREGERFWNELVKLNNGHHPALSTPAPAPQKADHFVESHEMVPQKPAEFTAEWLTPDGRCARCGTADLHKPECNFGPKETAPQKPEGERCPCECVPLNGHKPGETCACPCHAPASPKQEDK